LWSNAADRQRSAQTKRELARQAWTYLQNYADAKTAVVSTILARAEQARSNAQHADGSVRRARARRFRRSAKPPNTPLEPTASRARSLVF